MRPVLSRCPNYTNCLLGYRGEDIEVTEGMVAVCPECGTALVPKKKPRTALIPTLINWITIVLIVAAVWVAWPYVVQAWTKITTPPVETTEPSPPASPRTR